MCLVVDKRFHPGNLPLIASSNILVFKLLERDGKKYYTPFRCYPIKFFLGRFKYPKTRINITFEYDSGDIISGNIISLCDRGIHSCRRKEFYNTEVYYAIIPKGSEFYIGRDGDICSNQLIIYKKPPRIKGLKVLDAYLHEKFV